QAEDGIRDRNVTGVQTCALPIFKERFENLVKEKIRPSQRKPSIEIDTELKFTEIDARFLRILKQLMPFGPENSTPLFLTKNLKEIGRASCRERGQNSEHASAIQK